MESQSMAIEFGESLRDNFVKCCEKIGGFSLIIPTDRPVFIAYSMPFPEPSPASTSFAIMELVLAEIKALGVPQIYIAAIPEWGKDAVKVANLRGYVELARFFGAEFLDLPQIQRDTKNKGTFKPMFPQDLLNKSTYIALPSVRFDPSFGFLAASTINAQFADLKDKYPYGDPQECRKNPAGLQDKVVDMLFMVLNKRNPDLIIIDGHNVLAGQGPALITGGKHYNAKFILIGKNALAVDWILAKILGFEIKMLPHLIPASNAGLIDDQTLRLSDKVIRQQHKVVIALPDKPEMNLSGLLPSRIHIAEGNSCILCQRNLRFICDVLREIGQKDLLLVERLNFIIGNSAPPPLTKRNICIFGDCARIEMKTAPFWKIRIRRFKRTGFWRSKKKGSEKVVEEKIIIKKNKRVVEIPGCPPLPLDALTRITKTFSRPNFPFTTFWLDTWKELQSKFIRAQLKLLRKRRL